MTGPAIAYLNTGGNNNSWMDVPNVNHREPYVPKAVADAEWNAAIEAVAAASEQIIREGLGWPADEDPDSAVASSLACIARNFRALKRKAKTND